MTVYKEEVLGKTSIDISGKDVEVIVTRNENGNIEITPTEDGIFSEGGYLYNGTCTEGYNNEVIITKFKP